MFAAHTQGVFDPLPITCTGTCIQSRRALGTTTHLLATERALGRPFSEVYMGLTQGCSVGGCRTEEHVSLVFNNSRVSVASAKPAFGDKLVTKR